jgi:hypothetical protein
MAMTDAELEAKKDEILRYVRRGMTLDRAYLAAGLYPDDIAQIDTERMRYSATIADAQYEALLLKRLQAIMDINRYKGKSTELRFAIKAVSPRYANVDVPPSAPSVSVSITPYKDDE